MPDNTALVNDINYFAERFNRKHERKAHIAFSHTAESVSGRADDACPFYELQTEFLRRIEVGRDFCPCKHCALAFSHVPANFAQTIVQNIAPLLIFQALCLDAV